MNPFLRPRAARRRTRILAEAPSVRSAEGGTATLRLYDPIDSWGEFWGISAREFTEVLDELPDDTQHIRLLINSPGGEVYEGIAILNALRAHPARVTAVVEGIAASAASFVAAGVDELHMAQNSELMVHRAWAFAIGNAADLTQAADTLEHHDRNIANVYARKSGGDVDEWLAVMTAETYYSDQEAVDAGLADLVLDQDATEAVASARARFDLSALSSREPDPHTPAAGPRRPGRSPSATGRSTAVAFTDEQLAGMRTSLGLAEDADEATIIEAFDNAMTSLEELNEQPPVEQQSTVESAAARLPEGVVAVDRAQWEALQASAQRGEEARTQQERDVRLAVVNAAVSDGRIPASRRDAWVAQLEADPGAATTLASLAPGLVPVEARGHDGSPHAESATDPAAADDYWFAGVPTAASSREG